MKKRFLFGLGLLLTSVVFAAGTSYFVNIDTKVEGDGLTASEFNQILHVLNGIQNDGGRIGIGKAPVSNVKLDVNGIIKVTPLATGGTCGSSIEGSIYLDSDDSNWYGCNGTDWVQLAGAEGGCTPDCEGKECGDNGCGGNCGLCEADETCSASGQCITDCEPSDYTEGCYDGDVYWFDSCGQQNAEWKQNCNGLGCENAECLLPPEDCGGDTIDNCDLDEKASGETDGTCETGYDGSCSYTCTDGTWGAEFSNSCIFPTPPPVCEETIIDNCVLAEASPGDSNMIGQCSDGSADPNSDCSYSCTATGWEEEGGDYNYCCGGSKILICGDVDEEDPGDNLYTHDICGEWDGDSSDECEYGCYRAGIPGEDDACCVEDEYEDIPIYDEEGREYFTKSKKGQCWMDLMYTAYDRDGSPLFYEAGNYNNEYFDYSELYDEYLYSFAGAQKICPYGWRLSSDDDFKYLEYSLGMEMPELNYLDLPQRWPGGEELMNFLGDTDSPLRIGLGLKKYGMGRSYPNGSYYWSVNPDCLDTGCAWSRYNVNHPVTDSIKRASGYGIANMSDAMSVHCVKDVAPPPCESAIENNCAVDITPQGGVSGTCAIGYNGDCEYSCSNGTWTEESNSCESETTCLANEDLNHCGLEQTSHGGDSGDCINPYYAGYCKYVCNSGTWEESYNTCRIPNAGCGAGEISHCDLVYASHGIMMNGTCADGYTGICSYTCNNGNWGAEFENSCVPAPPPQPCQQYECFPNGGGSWFDMGSCSSPCSEQINASTTYTPGQSVCLWGGAPPASTCEP